MSFPFPHAKPKKLGYQPAEVDEFIAQVREKYNNQQDGSDLNIRIHEFGLVKGGYSVSSVDAALDKLEESFAVRRNQYLLQNTGHEALLEQANRIRIALVGRLERPKRHRFNSTGLVLRGYSKKEVDKFLVAVSNHIETRSSLSLDAVRKVLFTAKRGGYAENQVDAFIDRVIELLQIEQVL
ncbi:MAG: DivIVA domain-containing protein [Microbacteriaceae bacterium]|nr:DivIVA domain-containing protein [Microbacteriaceae bacterium]